jgi:hypothetical protein
MNDFTKLSATESDLTILCSGKVIRKANIEYSNSLQGQWRPAEHVEANESSDENADDDVAIEVP